MVSTSQLTRSARLCLAHPFEGGIKTCQASQAVIDRIADKKIVHKNLTSRTKSRLAQAIKAMA